MTFAKGNKASTGRAKGVPNKMTLKQAKKAAEEYGILPLDFFLKNLNDPKVPKPFKLDCAKAAAPYVHRKMPIGIDDGKGGPVQFATPDMLAKLTDKELAALQKIGEKLAAMSSIPGVVTRATSAESDSSADGE